jgi:hypothetical protein
MILRNKKEPLEKKTALGNPEKITKGSRWKAENTNRIWVVVEKKPFGRLVIQEEGRAIFGEPYQRMFLASHTRSPLVLTENGVMPGGQR